MIRKGRDDTYGVSIAAACRPLLAYSERAPVRLAISDERPPGNGGNNPERAERKAGALPAGRPDMCACTTTGPLPRAAIMRAALAFVIMAVARALIG